MRHEYLFIVPHMHVQVFLCTSPHLILPRYLEFAVWETKDIAHFFQYSQTESRNGFWSGLYIHHPWKNILQCQHLITIQ